MPRAYFSFIDFVFKNDSNIYYSIRDLVDLMVPTRKKTSKNWTINGSIVYDTNSINIRNKIDEDNLQFN